MEKISLSYVVRVNVLRSLQVGFIGMIFFWYVLAPVVECSISCICCGQKFESLCLEDHT